MNFELEETWSRIQSHLALVLDDDTYSLWLAQLAPVALDGRRLVIAAPPHTCRWVAGRFRSVIQASAELVLGDGVILDFQPTGAQPAPGGAVRVPPAQTQSETQASPTSGPLGNPRLSFDQFVIGDCNRLAHAAALTVAELPAQAYNPLFLCGPPGVGKTHLISAIANLLLAHNPGLTVRATTGEAFTNEFLAALTTRHTDSFKARFRDIDVLLVDDVQFLERKARTEEEFFHTFNALHDSGRQLVLTSDRPPQDLQALEDRLRERFQAGLVADVQPPDPGTRLAILRKRVHDDGIGLHDDAVLEVIAQRIASNVRALEGALVRVVAFSSLTGRPITSQLATELLDGLYPRQQHTERRTNTVADIQHAACQLFGIAPEELLSTTRSPRVAWPRQLAMYLSRELTDDSLPIIGRSFGGRDHTTILHAHRRTKVRLETDAEAREAVQRLCTALGIDSSTPTDRTA